MLFTWKQKCRKAASFLDSYNWEHRREENWQYNVRLVTETVAKILKIQIPENITPQETSFCVLDLITEFEYKQSQEVLFPSWLRRTREEQLAFIERDYGKFYEAVYKFDSDEQRCRVQMVEILSLYRFEGIEKFEVSDFFEYLRRYLMCFKDVKKDEMRLFLEKSLSAVWGVYLERQEDI